MLPVGTVMRVMMMMMVVVVIVMTMTLVMDHWRALAEGSSVSIPGLAVQTVHFQGSAQGTRLSHLKSATGLVAAFAALLLGCLPCLADGCLPLESIHHQLGLQRFRGRHGSAIILAGGRGRGEATRCGG